MSSSTRPPSRLLSSTPSLSPRRLSSSWIALTLCRLLLDRHTPLWLQVHPPRCAGSSPLLAEHSPAAGSRPLLAERSPPGGAAPSTTAPPCAAPGALSPALPRAAFDASAALPRAAPDASAALPCAAPTVPPGFATRSPATPAGASPAPGPDRQAARPLPPVQPYTRVYSRRDRAAPPPPVSPGAPPLPKGAVPVVPVVNEHRMVTRAKLGFRQPALC